MTRDSRTDPPSGRRVQPITNPQCCEFDSRESANAFQSRAVTEVAQATKR